MSARPKSTEELLSEILEVLKDGIERLEYSTVASVFPEPLSARAGRIKWYSFYGGSFFNRELMKIPAHKRVKIVEFKGSGMLLYLTMMVKMPDDTPPEVEWVVTCDGVEVEDWSVYEQAVLGMYSQPDYGGLMKYDTTNREYSNFGVWYWKFAKSLKIEIWNMTDVDVELYIYDCQWFSRT